MDASVEMGGVEVAPKDIFALVGARAERALPWSVPSVLGAVVSYEGVLS